MAKTFDDIIAEMVADVESTLGEQDTRSGTVLREGFLAPVAAQLVEAFDRTDTVEANQSIADPNAISEAAMNRLAANFGLARFPGSPASGSVRLFRFQAPSSPLTIPSGTILYTSDVGDSLQFRTLYAVTLSNASAQDVVTNAYYVDVAVIATINGAAGNVDTDTVRFHSISGIDEITNPNPMSGGKDTQTNAELAELIIARAQGNLGTRSGYESLVRDNFAVSDMDIITPTDNEALRAQYGGELDITILNEDTILTEETAAYNTLVFKPAFLPLTEVVEIIGIENITDLQKTLVPVADYDVIIDDFSPLNRSYKEKSKINLHVTSFAVKPNSVFTIRYKNSEIVRSIQAFLEDAQNQILGADVLVKLAIRISVDVSANIRIIPGFDATTVKANAEAAINSYLNSRMLGDDIQNSDIISVIANVDGVDSVDTSPSGFYMARADVNVDVDEVVANRQQYFRPNTVTVTVTN